MKRHAILALLLATLLLAKHAVAASPPPGATPSAVPVGWTLGTLPGARSDLLLSVLMRPALFLPARYRAIVVPGSGCTGWVPLAERFFAGMLHAELLVLHKPGVDISAGAAAECSPEFIQNDRLSAWRDHAQAALRAHFFNPPGPDAGESQLPVLLIGVSEGAELLPYLAVEVPSLAGVVMISAPGLDPREAGALQAQRLGQVTAWQLLENAQASDASDSSVQEGRTLRYWRDFWSWSLANPLLNAPWPLLRAWGDADALVSGVAYQRFSQQSYKRIAPMCDLRLPGADHGLQGAQIGQVGQQDGLQWLWARLELWARHPAKGLCEQVQP